MDLQRLFFTSKKNIANAATSVDSMTSRESAAEFPSDELELRRAKLGDLQALTDLLTRSFHASNQPFWLQAILRFSIQEDLRQRLQNSPSSHACWVAIHRSTGDDSNESGHLVGTIEMGMRSPLTLGWPLNIETWLSPNHTFLYISNLAVASSFRRKGIAKQLLQRCEKTAITWEQPDLYLHVLENNQAARNLYDLAGFGFERVDPSLESILFNRDRRQLWRKQLSTTQHP